MQVLENAPKPILKKSDSQKKRTRIVWDEENILHNETHKSATIKIDEPKTPFHYNTMDYIEDADDDDPQLVPKSPTEDTSNQGNGFQFHELESAIKKAQEKQNLTQNNTHKNRKIHVQDDEKPTHETYEHPNSEPEDEHSDHSNSNNIEYTGEFQEKRKHHYDEYQELMKWRNRKPESDDSDSDNTKSDGFVSGGNSNNNNAYEMDQSQ